MDSRIERHCRELDRCNQRGGRMLSVFDLLDARSLDLDLAAFLMARISRGASFMVGALPGGAGKTTVMCALLSFLPPNTEIIPATHDMLRQTHTSTQSTPQCYVCHEIGPGHYFSYLWDADLRAYCALIEQELIQLATNLHADDLTEAREQVCRQNRVPIANFQRFHLLLFLRVGCFGRRIEKVYASDGHTPHTLLYQYPNALTQAAPDPWQTQCRTFLETTLEQNIRTIEDTRKNVLDFLTANPRPTV